MRIYRVYQKLQSEKYKKYGDLLALLPQIAARERFTHNDIFLNIAPKERRNILRIFHNLELIQVLDNSPQLHTFGPSSGLNTFLKYTEVIGLKEFKMGPYKVFMDTAFLDAYLLPKQKPLRVTVTENIGSQIPGNKPFQQLVISGADGSRIAYFHIMGLIGPLDFIDQEKPGMMHWINSNIEISKINNAVLSAERIGSTWGWAVSGSIKEYEEGNESHYHIFRIFWDPFMKLEENLVKDQLLVLSSFMGLIPTGHLLKSIKFEKVDV